MSHQDIRSPHHMACGQPRLSATDMQAHMQHVVLNMPAPPCPAEMPAGIPQWIPGTFEGSSQVLVAFKSLELHENEHWLNRLACRMTALPGEQKPAGQLCHIELMLQVQPGQWHRFSINKKTCRHTETGKKEWLKGRVHCKHVRPESMREYHYCMLTANRAQQERMFSFLISQHNADFNFWGYVLNFFLPRWNSIGVKRWYPGIERLRKKWFCSELVCCALQAGGLCEDVPACCQSPNSMYRLCSRTSVGTGNPVLCADIRV